MSVSNKAGACVPCEIICVGQAVKKIKITKIFRQTLTRSGGQVEYLWQSFWESDGPTEINNLQCNKDLKGNAEEAIGNQVNDTLSNALTEWRANLGLETQTTDPNFRPRCADDSCASESGCQKNISATATMSFDLVASIVKEECIDDPDAPLTNVQVTPNGDPQITSSGC